MAGRDEHRGWVYYLTVAPEEQGSGGGWTLMRFAERWLAARGAVKVVLMIRESNADVRAFYGRLGYEEEPRITMSRWRSGTDVESGTDDAES